MNNLKQSILLALACGMCVVSGSAQALGDQWYFGIGGGASWLQPNAEQPGVGVNEALGTGGSVFFGVDLDDRSSGQLTLYSLGESELENQELVSYQAFDGSILYRLYDTKDTRLKRTGAHLALYGRFALGYMNRETDESLSNDAAVYFGAGGGAELFFTDHFSMRLEGMYHDSDAASGSLQLVARFGGSRRAPSRPTLRAPAIPQTDAAPVNPVPVVPAPTISEPSIPTPIAASDVDGDSVPDTQDQCPGSRAGFPVRATGCALFDGVLSGVSFVPGSAELVAGSTAQLDFLANVLAQYPQARVELHAHTDNSGTVRDQAILTRARLRTIGTYLVRQGVRSNRLVLRSFGGTQPLYDNGSTQGQQGNNRIEVIEKGN